MARRVLLVPLAVLAAGALVACSVYVDSRGPERGPQTTQARAVSAVSALDLGASGDLRLSVGAPSLSVTAGANVLPDLTTQVRGDTLAIELDHRWHDPGRITYDLTLPALSSITLGGSGTITGDAAGTGDAVLDLAGSGRIDLAALDAGALRVSVRGSGEVVVGRVTATSTVVDIDGSGQVRLAGRTSALDVSIPGSGVADVGALEARDARASIAGSGAAHVLATDTLDASISGSGAITYRGDAQVTSHVSGSGAVTRG
jgi:hypothetical protein